MTEPENIIEYEEAQTRIDIGLAVEVIDSMERSKGWHRCVFTAHKPGRYYRVPMVVDAKCGPKGTPGIPGIVEGRIPAGLDDEYVMELQELRSLNISPLHTVEAVTDGERPGWLGRGAGLVAHMTHLHPLDRDMVCSSCVSSQDVSVLRAQLAVAEKLAEIE